MRALFVLVALLVLAFSVEARATPVSGLVGFLSYLNNDCGGNTTAANVTIATDTCLNNHDFSKVSCSILESCLNSVPTMSYEQLVECSGAPSMHLSVILTAFTDGAIKVHAYAGSKTCHGLSAPIPEEVGSCSTFFAFNKDCYASGIFNFVQDFCCFFY